MPANQPDHTDAPDATPAPDLEIDSWHRRLARYLYLDDLIRGRRLLEVGDGRSASFLAGRGAGQVVHAAPQALAGGELGERRFDVVLLEGGDLLRRDEVLREARRVLAPGGHVVVAVRSKEADPEAAAAVGYFELIDRLEQVGRLGPVAMLGQSPFLATTLVPFGEESPDLVMDDSLAGQAPPQEYVAICGPRTRPRPFQVIQLPLAAAQAPVPVPAPVQDKTTTAAPIAREVAAERERLQGEVSRLQQACEDLGQRIATLQGEAAQAAERQRQAEARHREELARAGAQAEDRRREAQEARREAQEAHGRLQRAQEALHRAEAQLAEERELSRRFEQGLREVQEAAIHHDRERREMRGVLEEREAYIAELEGQTRELPLLQEAAVLARRQAEQAAQAERAARQKLAQVSGALLRTQGELSALREPGTAAPVSAAADAAAWAELEAQRRELEQAERQLSEERQALGAAQAAMQEDRQELARGAAEVSELRERLESERLLAAQDREELRRLREEMEREGERAVGRDVPIPVGDLPTAPHVSLTTSIPVSPQEEIARLQARLGELEAENARLKEKASDAERDSWKHMKARSDAEAAAAEARDDAARKLRDARKLASVELTRAMEEATKKAVSLREELTRTERERKDALAQVKDLRAARDAAQREVDGLRQELEALRWSSALQAPGGAVEAADGAQAQVQVHKEITRAREESAAAVLAVRADAERALAEERGARQGAEEAERQARAHLAELRASVLGLELSLGEARDSAEAERRRVEMLQEEIRRLSDESAARQREAEGEIARAQADVQARERALGDLRVEREALGRLLAEVEREAYSRAERARELRTRMLERDREVEALRVELLDRDRKIAALEQQVPPGEELIRLEAELQATRARLSEMEAERARQDAASDEAVATALRERARAARLTESLQQAARERDEALGRCVELEGRVQGVQEERNRLRGEITRLEETSRQAQAELHGLVERLKQTRRELEAEEKRAAREGERAQEAAELGQRMQEARRELSDLRVRSLEQQAELARCRALLARFDVEAPPSATTLPEGLQEAPAEEEPAAPPEGLTEGTQGAPLSGEAAGQSADQKPPVLEHHMVRRVLALGQALGLEPLHAPLPGSEPGDGGDKKE